MSLVNVYDNFIWRIESITPTEQSCDKRFRLDRGKVEPTRASGAVRSFELRWNSSDADEGETDITERRASHEWLLSVYYPDQLGVDQLHRLVLSDRHDLIEALRHPDLYLGTSDSASTTNIGLWSRVRLRDELVAQGTDGYRLRILWQTLVRESEV